MRALLVALLVAQVADPDAYRRVQDEGTNLPKRRTIDFAGAGVTCADGSGKTTCTIAGGAGGLPADPAACPAGQYVTDQNASGTLTCSTPAPAAGSAGEIQYSGGSGALDSEPAFTYEETTNAMVVQSGTITAARFTSNGAAGQNAFVIQNSGAMLDMGAGASDYFDILSSLVHSKGNLVIADFFGTLYAAAVNSSGNTGADLALTASDDVTISGNNGSGTTISITAGSGSGVVSLSGAITLGGATKIGNASATNITDTRRATATWDPGSINANSCTNTDITVTGCAAGADTIVGPPAALEEGLLITALISATNTCHIHLCNGSATPIDPASGTWACRCFNP